MKSYRLKASLGDTRACPYITLESPDEELEYFTQAPLCCYAEDGECTEGFPSLCFEVMK